MEPHFMDRSIAGDETWVYWFSNPFKLLNPLVNNCMAQTIITITEGSSQHLQRFCTGFQISYTKFNAQSSLSRGIHYERDKD
jgi:hypothetical protein